MASVKQPIHTDAAPTPTGPFNQAIRIGNLVFTSGQAGRNRETGKMGDIRDQARRCIGNIEAILGEAGASLADVVKVTVYLRNAGDAPAFNDRISQADAGTPTGQVIGLCRAQEPRNAGRDGGRGGAARIAEGDRSQCR